MSNSLSTPRHKLRRALAEDAEFLYSVYETTARPLVEGIGRRWAEAKMREKCMAECQDGRTQVVMVGERRVGFFSVELRAEELWLHSLFLLPEVQRTGLGRALLTETLATARQRGIPVRCQVMSFNPAVGFYERFGFTQYEAEEDCVYLQSSA